MYRKPRRVKHRRCPKCARFIGKRNTTLYYQEFLDRFKSRGSRELRSCNNCGRRGLWFWWNTWDHVLKTVYAQNLVDLLNTPVTLFERFRRVG